MLGSFGLRRLLFGDTERYPFLLAFPTVVLVGVVFNQGTGIFASLLSVVVAASLVLPPVGSLYVADPNNVVGAAVYMASSVIVAVLMEALHVACAELARSYVAAERSAEELRAANCQLAAASSDRETLLREAVHRSRNDLQRLSASLHLQIATTADATAQAALREAVMRVEALARVNGRLEGYWHTAGDAVDSQAFIEGLAADLRLAIINLRPITLIVEAESHPLTATRAIAVGLILNELVTNSLKYAFPGDQAGRIFIRFRQETDVFALSVEDDGIGIAEGAAPQGTGLGRRLVRALAAQLGGGTNLPSRPTENAADAAPQEEGSRFVVRFPVLDRKAMPGRLHAVAGAAASEAAA